MAAGLAMLDLIQAPGFYAELDRRTRLLTDAFAAAAASAGVPLTINRVCGMFGLFFTAQKVETYAQATACDTAAFNCFFHAMLERGVYLAPSAFEAGFVSRAHDEAIIAATLEAAREAFAVVKS
jgi:glutamate-1-semialdehyde 2,1-aminomutase